MAVSGSLKLELPEWLGPQRPNRTRAFLVVKCILFICLVVAIIETILFIPIYYKILADEARKAPVGDNYNVWVVAGSTAMSIILLLIIIGVGIVGVLRENVALIVIFGSVLMAGVVLSLITFRDKIIVIFAAISNTLVAAVAYFLAYMIYRYDRIA